ncbi:putative F-box protein At5g15660 [Rosa chinensis]|uniref:putative F-box protein At5g15660 n=1 Tax=Rosa chinensis TaxID=74649 RepID=UPI000D08F0A2|nr:putative F-box protein At5g15660 [Rosa chinensis]
MSTAATEHLPEDLIIVQILTRLPIKSLIRFSCFSKCWSSIILSDQRFAKSQFKFASESKTLSRRLLLATSSKLESLDPQTTPFPDDSSIRKLTCPFNQPERVDYVLGSCNGMVCVALDFHDGYYIWNPSTALFLKLPNPNFASEGVISFYPKMPDFDRSKTIIALHYWGFGYVSATDDYKVVVEALFADSKMYVEVFSS